MPPRSPGSIPDGGATPLSFGSAPASSRARFSPAFREKTYRDAATTTPWQPAGLVAVVKARFTPLLWAKCHPFTVVFRWWKWDNVQAVALVLLSVEDKGSLPNRRGGVEGPGSVETRPIGAPVKTFPNLDKHAGSGVLLAL